MTTPIDKIFLQTLKPVGGETNSTEPLSCLVSFEPVSSVSPPPAPVLVQIPGHQLDATIDKLHGLRDQLAALASRH